MISDRFYGISAIGHCCCRRDVRRWQGSGPPRYLRCANQQSKFRDWYSIFLDSRWGLEVENRLLSWVGNIKFPEFGGRFANIMIWLFSRNRNRWEAVINSWRNTCWTRVHLTILKLGALSRSRRRVPWASLMRRLALAATLIPKIQPLCGKTSGRGCQRRMYRTRNYSLYISTEPSGKKQEK